MLMYAGNIYFWRRYRVNYSFIFGIKQGTELGYREVLFLGFGVAVLALASVLPNLEQTDPETEDYIAFTELLPLGLLVVRLSNSFHPLAPSDYQNMNAPQWFLSFLQLVIVILICPLNIIYRSCRFFFLKCLFHCFCAPLYKVINGGRLTNLKS